MPLSLPLVISASRRTDIPAFYMDWFMAAIHRGHFEVVNPFNRMTTRVPANPGKVHTIVFWSKDFGHFLENGYGDQLTKMGYHLFFNFTINSDCFILEPNVPPLDRRLDQLGSLCHRFGPDCVTWRFDPICVFAVADETKDNLIDFGRILKSANRLGIKRCVTSFMNDYAKIRKRAGQIRGFRFIAPEPERKLEILLSMENEMKGMDMQLLTCCEKTLIASLPETSGIKSSSCIPNDLLMNLFGGRVTLKKDAGQRVKQGCGCKTSVDIGSYHLHPCFHDCLFCYANPSPKGQEPEIKKTI